MTFNIAYILICHAIVIEICSGCKHFNDCNGRDLDYYDLYQLCFVGRQFSAVYYLEFNSTNGASWILHLFVGVVQNKAGQNQI
jgi:hypothetical protein